MHRLTRSALVTRHLNDKMGISRHFSSQPSINPIMADSNRSCRGSNVSERENNNFSTAIDLLRQATNILAGSTSSSGTSGSSAHSTPRSNHEQGGEVSQSTIPHVSTHPITSTSQTARDSAVLSNFRDLFSPYGSLASSSQKSQRPKSTPRRGNRFTPYKPKETWTHEFFLLANPEQTILPNKSDRIKLQDAGLGRKKLSLATRMEQWK